MPLQKQVIPVPFGQGVDTKTDPKQLAMGKLAALVNGMFQTAKKIRKRFGFTRFANGTTNGGSITSGSVLATYAEDTLLEFDGQRAYGYSPALNEWSEKGQYVPAKSTVQNVDNSFEQSQNISLAQHPSNGIYCYAVINIDPKTSNRLLEIIIKDPSSGDTIFQDLAAVDAFVPKVHVAGPYFFISYVKAGDPTKIFYNRVTAANPTSIGSPGVYVTDLNAASTNYDCTEINGKIYYAYNSTGAGGSIGLFTVNSSGTQSGVTYHTSGGANANGGLTIFGDELFNAWVAYINVRAGFNDVNYFIYSQNFAALVLTDTPVATHASPPAIVNIIGIANGPSGGTERAIIFYSDVTQTTWRGDLALDGSVHSESAFNVWLEIWSKPFLYRGIVYFVGHYVSNVQPTLFLMDQNNHVVAKINSSTASPSSLASFANDIILDSDGHYKFGALQSYILGVFGGTVLGSGAISVTISMNEPQQKVTEAQNLHVSGGLLWMYDGLNFIEHNFLLYPEITAINATATGGGSLSAGTYAYVFVYEYIDNQGQIHRSAPSPASEVVVGPPNNAVQVTVKNLTVTYKYPVSITGYRTVANGTVFYRFTNPSAITVNDTSTKTITLLDTLSDAALLANEQLYTTGGEVENISVPACSSLTSYKNRLIALPTERPNEFWYSKQIQEGVPVEFSDLFVQQIDQTGGPAVAVAAMDDKLLFGKMYNWLYLSGQGPTASGANNDFTTASLITTDVGVVEAVSVVQTPNGIMFKSHKGIYLLDRSLQAQYIGAEVEAYNQYTITSALLHADVNQVRFTLSNGKMLVYDYYFSQWSVYDSIDAADATILSGKFTYVTPAGVVSQENQSIYTDNNGFVPLSITTGWLSFAGVQGFQRVYKADILGDYKGSHQLVVQVAYDFDSTVVQTDTINATLIAPNVYQWRIFFQRQKCQAIQITISDTQSSSFNEGFDLSDLTFEVGVKTGVFKLPASQSFG